MRDLKSPFQNNTNIQSPNPGQYEKHTGSSVGKIKMKLDEITPDMYAHRGGVFGISQQ